MKDAYMIEDMPAIDVTARDVLRILALKIGEKDEAFVDFDIVAKSLNISRDATSKAVKRLVKKRVVRIKNRKISIVGTVKVE